MSLIKPKAFKGLQHKKRMLWSEELGEHYYEETIKIIYEQRNIESFFYRKDGFEKSSINKRLAKARIYPKVFRTEDIRLFPEKVQNVVYLQKTSQKSSLNRTEQYEKV